MDLKKFVAETLRQIVEGVVDAQNSVDDDAVIAASPEVHSANLGKMLETVMGDPITPVEFDVAVGVSRQQKGEAGGGLMVAFVGAGAKASDQSTSTNHSRIKFTVNVVLPDAQKRRLNQRGRD